MTIGRWGISKKRHAWTTFMNKVNSRYMEATYASHCQVQRALIMVAHLENQILAKAAIPIKVNCTGNMGRELKS